jgi:hypothetical protein
MPFQPNNNANPKGRPIGTRNRSKQPLCQRIETLVLNNLDRIEKDIEQVSSEVRMEMIANLAGLVNLNKHTTNEIYFNNKRMAEGIKVLSEDVQGAAEVKPKHQILTVGPDTKELAPLEHVQFSEADGSGAGVFTNDAQFE